MLNALELIPELGRRERRVRALAARAEHDQLTLRRAARRFAAQLAYEITRPRGLAACFAAGCILGSRSAGPIVALAFAGTSRLARALGASDHRYDESPVGEREPGPHHEDARQ